MEFSLIFLTKRDYSDSIPDSDADDLCICGISAVQNEVPVPRGYLCRNRGNDVHPDACYADPHVQDNYEHGLSDKMFSLVGPYVTFALPMSIFILTAFMMTIPKEVEESPEIISETSSAISSR